MPVGEQPAGEVQAQEARAAGDRPLHQWFASPRCRMPGSRAPSQGPHSFAAEAGSLGKNEGGLWRRVIAGQAPVNGAGRATNAEGYWPPEATVPAARAAS